MNELPADLLPLLPPALVVVLGTLVAASLLVSTLVQAIALFAIFLPQSMRVRAKQVLRILRGQADIRHENDATEEVDPDDSGQQPHL